ncbi:MAG: TrkA family potassium uptake protein [Clostridiales bacterium]|nr:TrkA family potassium uptake protein [Clostridiales bacterium]
MFKNNKLKKTTYGIIGLGRFGKALAIDLAEAGEEILVIDKDEECVRELREYTENAFLVHSLDKNTLYDTGVQNCDIVILCIGEHLDTSILTALHLVGMNIPKVIAKANSVEHGEILEKLGVEVVYPERDMAHRLASRLEISRVIDFMQLSEKVNISKLLVPECMVGKSVHEVNVRSRFGLNIILIENNGNLVENIMPEYIFKKEDVLFLCGNKEKIFRFTEWAEKR